MKKQYLLIFSLFCCALIFAQTPGNSLQFDGGLNHVTADLPVVFDDIQNNDITVEAQVRYTGAVFTRVFFAQKDANNYFNISMTSFSGQVELYVYVATAGIVYSVRTTEGLIAGENHHIAARWTAATTTVEVFIDGVQAGVSFGGDSSTGTSNVMTIGARSDGSQAFNGDIDELAIWNEARLLCLLVQDANEGVNPATSNLVAYYTFNQGVAGGDNSGITTLIDATGNFPGTLQNFALSGNTSNFISSQAFDDVIVAPDTNPVALCQPPFTIQLDANGEASITVNDIDNGSFDPCGVASITIDKTTFTCADVGPNIVTLTITATNGNTATCTTIVTVEDTVPPIAQCAAPFTVQLDANGLANITPEMIDNGSTDNCEIASLSLDITQFTCADIGDNTVTLTVTDTNGNTATCTTVVTVEDTLDPIAVCVAPFTIQLDANGEASITAADIDGGSTASCGTVTLAIDITDFTCADIGENTITLTVTDGNGNFASCTTVVTVEDNVAPTALCAAPFTIQLDANGTASITAADINNGSTDACGIDTLTISQTDFDCSHVGDNTITLTVTDVNGNSSTCTTIVTVEDNVAPTALCVAPFTIQLDANGTASITAADIDNGSTDACGIDTLTISQTDFDCSHIGDNTITLTVTDVNGNTSTCTTVVTVEDNVAPSALCVAPFTIQLDVNGNASITAADINNGSTDACGIDTVIISQTDFDCSHVGDNTITLTVTDVNGNSATCTTIVTVEDSVAPEALCAAPFTIQLDANGQATITAADIDNGSTDACGIASITISPSSFDCTNQGENTVTLTVIDVNGNESTCTTIVTVEGATAPVVTCTDLTLELGPDGTATLTAEDIGSYIADCGTAITAIDIEFFDCSNIGTPVLVTYFATDGAGNNVSCTAMVTVIDNLAPVIECPADQTVDTDPASITYTLPDYFADGLATATDNCTTPVAQFTQTPAPGTLLLDGTYTVTLTATDEYGNESTCSFELTVDTILGAEDNDFSGLTMYPNPAVNEVTIGNPQFMAIDKISVYDILGRLVLSKNTNGDTGNQTFNVSDLSSAVYMVVIESEGRQTVKRLVRS